jgi:hypothetical protein
MTAAEFANGYARRSGVTVEWLRSHGQAPMPCDCGETGCRGWQMVTTADNTPTNSVVREHEPEATR